MTSPTNGPFEPTGAEWTQLPFANLGIFLGDERQCDDGCANYHDHEEYSNANHM
jgi:hypothetical protein